MTLTVIFDGSCGFCRRSLRPFQRLDRKGNLELVDGNRRDEVVAQYPQLAAADFVHAMYVVDEAGRSWHGFYAFRRLMWNSALTSIGAPLLYLPGVALIGTRVYAWVASHRHSFGGPLECRIDKGKGAS